MNARATLSAILPNYNHAKFLPEALQAMLAQTRPPDEIIVIDDASKDDSVALLKEWARKHSRIKLHVNEKNLGVVATLNKGLELAASDYVYMAAADDCILPSLYETAMGMLESHPEAGFFSALSLQMDEQGRPLGFYESPIVASKPVFLSKQECRELIMKIGPWFMNNAAVFKKSAMTWAGLLRPELASYADGFCSEAIALREGVCFAPQPLAVWRRMPGGFSSGVSRQIERRLGIMASAEALMKNEFREQFPDEYPQLWRRRQLILLLKEQASATMDRDALSELRKRWPTLSLPDRLFKFWLGLRKKVDGWAVVLYDLIQRSARQNADYLRRKFWRITMGKQWN